MPRPTPSSKRPLLIWSSMQISSTRMVERKRIDQRTEAQALRALSHRGEENAGRGGKAERRRVMFGGVVRIETAAIVGFDDLQPLLVECVQRTIVAIEVVENADFHSFSRRGLAWACHHRRKRAGEQDRPGVRSCMIGACGPS